MDQALQRALVESQEYAELLRTTTDKSSIRLTLHDDAIFHDWRQTFPGVSVTRFGPHALRVHQAQADAFISRWSSSVADPLAPALLRKDVRRGFTSDNVVLVCRIIARAVEAVRNRSV